MSGVNFLVKPKGKDEGFGKQALLGRDVSGQSLLSSTTNVGLLSKLAAHW